MGSPPGQVPAGDGRRGNAGPWLPWLLAAAAFFALLSYLLLELRSQGAELERLERQVRALQEADAARDPQWRSPGSTTGVGGARRPPSPRPSLAAGRPAAGPPGGEASPSRPTLRQRFSPADVLEGPALRSALVDLLDSEDPDVQVRLQDIVRTQREAERDRRREERQQHWEERTLARLSELAGAQGLDRGQQDALFAILSRNRDRATEAFRAARADHSFGEARELAQGFRKEADAEARELLDEDQYTAYVSMREEERERRGFSRARHGDRDRAAGKAGEGKPADRR